MSESDNISNRFCHGFARFQCQVGFWKRISSFQCRIFFQQPANAKNTSQDTCLGWRHGDFIENILQINDEFGAVNNRDKPMDMSKVD